jgi:integrase
MASIKRRTTNTGSARYDVRWRPSPSDGERCRTFPTLEAARAFRAQIDAEMARGLVFDPRAGRILFRHFAEEWLEARGLSDMTRETYIDALARHIYPTFGDVAVNKITPSAVRRWHRPLADRVPATAAKCYRIFRAILATAVEDQLIARNPCSIRGAGQDPEVVHKFVPAETVLELSRAAHPLLAPMILLAGFGGLRYGELRALRVRHYDDKSGAVAVEEAIDKRSRRKGPKTRAGRRTVHLPHFVVDALDEHLATLESVEADSPLLPGPAGGVMSDGWHKREWGVARRRVGVPQVRFHDLRHTAGTLVAQQGATLREVMSRLGHSTTAAAIRYQRAAETRDQELADRLDRLVVDLSERRAARGAQINPATRAGWPRDERQDHPLVLPFEASEQGTSKHPQRDSNPCRHLERVVS